MSNSVNLFQLIGVTIIS